jgi:hypothetical protein
VKKPLIIFLLLLFFYIIPICADEISSKNTISGGISAIWVGENFLRVPILPGLDIEYERLLHNNFSLAVDVGLDGLIVLYADLYARWYPWAGKFFANIGLGISKRGFETWTLFPAISPGIGWKIDIGKPNGWNLITGITGRIFFYEDQREYEVRREIDRTVDITAKVFFRVGYSF